MSHSLHNWTSPSDVPELSDANCHIWKIDLNTIAPGDSLTLSLAEIQRAEKFYRIEDKQRFISIRSILRQLLSIYLRLPSKSIELSANPHGKPCLKPNTQVEPLYFNISHSKDLAMLAFCRLNEVGIDVEYIERPANYRKLAQRFFSKQENIAIASVDDNELTQMFFRLWTRKEAFVKAVGTGLSFPLNKFSVGLTPANKPILVEVDKTRYDGPCSLSDIKCQPSYMSSIASLSDKLQYKLYQWPLTVD